MDIIISNKKRAIMLCVFFMFGCSPPSTDNQQSSSNATVTAVGSKDDLSSPSTQDPLLSLSELLAASDVKAGLALAAANKDKQALEDWQAALLLAADEVQLSNQERGLISGEMGLSYLEFEGMKTNYQAAFEDAFFNFEDVDRVYAQYPAFKNLHKQSKDIVVQRDALVSSVAKELETQGLDPDTALAEARRQWQNFVTTQQSASLQK